MTNEEAKWTALLNVRRRRIVEQNIELSRRAEIDEIAARRAEIITIRQNIQEMETIIEAHDKKTRLLNCIMGSAVVLAFVAPIANYFIMKWFAKASAAKALLHN